MNWKQLTTSFTLSVIQLKMRGRIHNTVRWSKSIFYAVCFIYHIMLLFCYVRWVTVNMFIYRIWALMTWTMQRWVSIQKLKLEEGLHQTESWRQMWFMLPPDRLRKLLELQLRVKLIWSLVCCCTCYCGNHQLCVYQPKVESQPQEDRSAAL